ncbi:NADH:flavin oxidoreductase [Coleofasciculus chthonoplastes]|uniref:NADH:flavin oxidoreductase n=1 Tax=Coleofasciculus chthonoplastes TaxID=64178 RepID=UPI0032F64E4D
MVNDIIFEPLKFRNLTVKNRIFRANTYGNFDDPDGLGTPARLRWEERFAQGGVGAILSGVAPIHNQGRMAPHCATIESDRTIPFWRQVAEAVHKWDCKYILQISYGGSHLGNLSQRMTLEQIQETMQWFADATRRAREAGLDGVEVDGTSGGTGRLLGDLESGGTRVPVNLIGQFLSPTVNQREDEYGGSLKERSRFLLDTLKMIRQQVGQDFHVQVKVGALDTRENSVQLCQWIEQAGADALHLGSKVPYPQAANNHFPLDIKGDHIDRSHSIKQSVHIPVLCTGGFQTATYIRQVIHGGYCDGVTLARALIANPDLVQQFAQGKDSPDQPCSYCEKCRINLVENPLGCYDVSRYDGDYGKMSREIMSVYLGNEIRQS